MPSSDEQVKELRDLDVRIVKALIGPAKQPDAKQPAELNDPERRRP